MVTVAAGLAIAALVVALDLTGAVAQSGQAPGWSQLSSVPADAWTVAPDGRNPGTLYAHGPAGISRSTDGGTSWELCNADARSLAVLSPPEGSERGTVLYATTAGGLRSSNDGCRTWSDVPSAVTQTRGLRINWLAPYPNNYDILYAGLNGLGGLYRSTDRGSTWQPASEGLPPGSHVTSLSADPRKPEYVFAGLRYDTDRHPPAYVYRSTDGGLSWRSSSRGIDVMPNNGCLVTGLAWAGSDLLAATLYDGIYRSSDQGVTWQHSPTPQRSDPARAANPDGAPRPVAVHRLTGTAGGVLLIATTEGAFQSLDGGHSWVSFGPREIAGAPVLLGIEPNSGRVIAVGPGGAWSYRITESPAQAVTPAPGGAPERTVTPPPPPQLPTSTPAPPSATPTPTPVPPTSTPAPVEGPKPTDPAPPGDPAVSDFFPETGHNIRYGFRDFWKANGGVALFGFPITEEFVENGIPVQYFERVRLEYRDGRVQLGLLGRELTAGTFYRTVPFFPSDDENVYFGTTGHSLSGPFLEFWRTNGGESVFGYPISESYREDGSEYQWFERGRFEWHPYLPEDNRIVLGNIGTEALKRRGWLR